MPAVDDRVAKFREHLEYLRGDLESLNQQRNKVEREIALVEPTIKNHQDLYNSVIGAYPKAQEASPRKYRGMSQVEAARRFLPEHDNKPHHAKEIWTAISAEGITSKADEPVWFLATNLKVHRDFEAIGDKKVTFPLKEEAYRAELEKIKKETLEGRSS